MSGRAAAVLRQLPSETRNSKPETKFHCHEQNPL
jgi:hypothetical protein